MTLNISNKIYVVAAFTALAALGAYVYTTRKVQEPTDVDSDKETQ